MNGNSHYKKQLHLTSSPETSLKSLLKPLYDQQHLNGGKVKAKSKMVLQFSSTDGADIN